MENIIADMWQEYDLDALGNQIDQLFPVGGLSLDRLIELIITGDILGALSLMWQASFGGIGAQMEGMKQVFVSLLVVGIFAALISHFVDVFDNHQIADMSFYFTYLLINTMLLRCFHEIATVGSDAMNEIVSFIQIYVPTYLVTVGVATGPTTAYANYSILLVLIYVVQRVLVNVAIPLIYGYVFVAMLNGIWWDEKLNLLMGLIEKGIALLFKIILGMVSGIGLIQSMITPVIDSVKNTGLQKAISAIPGIGNAAEGVVEVVLGSAVVIKNSLGILGLLILLGICMVPLLKIFLISCVIKIAASLLGFISDKRITNLTDKVGSGGMLVLKTTGTAMLLFGVTISMAAFAVK
ncbi:MAG: stage III sporulation protein AE [Lachnospiraceae bacterium]|nr:stage III sporulation protein AE [Lachnospiraceae bacterium]